MYACGLRIGEAVALEVGSVDKVNRLLRVIGKGNRERCVPLPQPSYEDLRKLWQSHRNPRWLFPNRSNTGPVASETLHNTFAAAARAAGIVGVTGMSDILCKRRRVQTGIPGKRSACLDRPSRDLELGPRLSRSS
jgi:site-specific recombinase XerD